MKDFPVEEFANVRSFSVYGNCIELRHHGQPVRITFDSEAELFEFLRAWTRLPREKTTGGSMQHPNQQLSPSRRASVFA